MSYGYIKITKPAGNVVKFVIFERGEGGLDGRPSCERIEGQRGD